MNVIKLEKDDLVSIATFNKIVRNYIKMTRMLNEESMLDEADVISLGWVFVDQHENDFEQKVCVFKKQWGSYDNCCDWLTLTLDYKNHSPLVNVDISRDRWFQTAFRGFIKCKAELELLMQQLSIK